MNDYPEPPENREYNGPPIECIRCGALHDTPDTLKCVGPAQGVCLDTAACDATLEQAASDAGLAAYDEALARGDVL